MKKDDDRSPMGIHWSLPVLVVLGAIVLLTAAFLVT